MNNVDIFVIENINNKTTLSKQGHDRVFNKTIKKCASKQPSVQNKVLRKDNAMIKRTDNHSGSMLNKNESNIQCEYILDRKRGRAGVNDDDDKPPKKFKKEPENALSVKVILRF